MTKSQRQQYGFGSFVKKITRPIKKIVKSPLGKAALIGGLGYLAPKAFGTTWGGTGGWGSKIAGAFGNKKGLIAQLIRKKDKAGNYGGLSMGKLGLMGLLGAGTALPFLGGDDDEEVVEDAWSVTPNAISDIRNMARNRDPSLAFLPSNAYAQSGYYLKDGGLAKLANGGGVAEAQAEQMLKMEYQKYRNQGGTMSYQQFKMTVLKQAQGQGPMAQGQPQMAAQGGRIGYEDGSRGPHGKTDLEILEELYPTLFSDTTTSIEGSPKKKKYTKGKAQGGRIGLLGGGPVPGSTVPGYTTPVGYNKFDYRTGGIPVRVGRAEGGLMSLGGMEKDYRNEGGFVPLGKKEKADDVPARLSKNEFVFTADAVRNAGGGDIDAGAEVMENVMKNLEAGGQISEESQGAQGMYNNMKQLETRIA